MVRRIFLWLLPLGLIAILGRPLNISSGPATDTDTSAVLAEALEQQDVNPGTTPSERMSLLSWNFIALDLLVSGLSFCWWLWRRRGQVREGGKSGG